MPPPRNNITLNERLIEEKRRLLTITAFGCNRQGEEELKKISDSPFVYYEYFLRDPVCRSLARKRDAYTDSLRLMIPFVERLLWKFGFVPWIKAKDLRDSMDSENEMRRFLNKWFQQPKYRPVKRKYVIDFLSSLEDNYLDQTSIAEKTYKQWIKGKDNNLVKHSLNIPEALKEIPKRKPNNARKAGFYDYLITGEVWLRRGIKQVQLLAYPIASKCMYFGNISFIHVNTIIEEEYKNIAEGLKRLAEDVYLPVLTLFQNYWQEHLLHEGLSNREYLMQWEVADSVKLSSIQKTNDNSDVQLTFLNPILIDGNRHEQALYGLWKKRKALYDNEKLKDHLVFAKCNIASPKMLSLVDQVISQNLKKTRDFLPSTLIIGEPGSGKDAIAKLCAILSNDYSAGEVISLNMASLKPEAISTPLITGVKTTQIEIEGIFSQIQSKDYNKGSYPTLILDELNSLDIDAQGALLRILENSEICPLGAVFKKENDKELNVLVIGVMNENPDKLTKESALRDILTQHKVLGGLVGEILYEHVRQLRRLREDLYYRLIRGGRFDIPSLKERREDIPILFYIFCKDEIQARCTMEHPTVTLMIDFMAYEELMSERLRWDGNIRELQALTKDVFDESTTFRKDQNLNEESMKIQKNNLEVLKKGKGKFKITTTHIREALKYQEDIV